MMLCDYGCGKIAIHQLTNKKWCCSKSCNGCDIIKKKTTHHLLKGTKIKNKRSKEYKDNMKEICKKGAEEIITDYLCEYGCGEIAHFQFKNGKFCCSKSIQFCNCIRNKKSITVKNNWNNEDIRKKQIDGIIANASHTPKTEAEKNNLSNKMKDLWRDPSSIFNSEGYREKESEKSRQRMLNGGALKALKGIKNPSVPGVMLRDIVLELYPAADPEHGVFNYSIDVAILEHKIAIEYDGWHHFKSPEAIEYHNMRQKRIEGEGWKFLRYNIFKKFPSREQIKNDLIKVIEDK